MKTYVATPTDRERNWLLVDAEGQTLGRLATRIADALRGKRKPTYTPHVDVGDFVVVVNAEKIAVTGQKLREKMYYRHSGDRKSTRLNSSHANISYAVFCLKKKKIYITIQLHQQALCHT